MQGERETPETTRKTGSASFKSGAEETSFASSASVAAFSHKVGVIFCAMYNAFVDVDVLDTIQSVAGRLAASAASPTEWASTELGRFVHFANDRSQDRVQELLALYADESLQGTKPRAKLIRERSAFITARIPEGPTTRSRTMGLASFRQPECMGAYSIMSQQCEREIDTITWGEYLCTVCRC